MPGKNWVLIFGDLTRGLLPVTLRTVKLVPHPLDAIKNCCLCLVKSATLVPYPHSPGKVPKKLEFNV